MAARRIAAKTTKKSTKFTPATRPPIPRPWINPFPDTDPLSLIHIAGDTDQQNKLRLLCNEFRDIFSNELPTSPANIPPFDLAVDDTKWKVSRNRAPPRPQSAANQAGIARQIAVLQNQGIIEKSNAA
jgi:hypothetical protein